MDRDVRELLVDGASRMEITLSEEAVSRFSIYLALLQTWGSKINLTSRLRGKEVVTHHFLDSLAGMRFLSSMPEAHVIDLGAGAGFPSIPLKFVLPRVSFTLVESVRKKVSFCQQVIRDTRIAGVEVLWGRGEELGRRPEHQGRYDWAISRALGTSSDVVKLGIPFLATGGRVLLFKAEPDDDELRQLDLLSARIGAVWELHSVRVPYLEEARSLILVRMDSVHRSPQA